jgi:hypothetical protein
MTRPQVMPIERGLRTMIFSGSTTERNTRTRSRKNEARTKAKKSGVEST